MESECFRIKLNLSEFFTDQRKLSYILIDMNKLNDFYDLERRIRRIFAINEKFMFLIDNIFVPHSESIKLIHEEETLTVVADTVGLDTFVVKPNFGRKVGTLIKAARKKKKKDLVCQEGCQECFHYIPTKRKRRIIETLNQCNTQDASYPCEESDTIMPDCETVEIHGTENEMFLRMNKVYNFGKEKHVDDSDSPHRKKKKVQFEKKVKKYNAKPNVLEEKTIDNETENKSIKDEGGKYDPTEICENVNIKEITVSPESCNPRVNNILLNEVPIPNSIINVSKPTRIKTRRQKQADSKLPNITGLPTLLQNSTENCENVNIKEITVSPESCNPQVNNILLNEVPIPNSIINVSKPTRIKTRRQKQADSKSPNITGLPTLLQNSKTHTRFSENEINSTKEKFSEIQADMFINQNDVSEAYDKVVNKTHGSISEFCSSLPLKSEAFMARMKSPNPADIFRKLLSPPLVFNQTCNSKTSQEDTCNDEDQPIIINCDDDDDDFINLEKYPLINSSPRKGDILAFKLNKVVSTCASNITEYIVAEVIKYCEDTSQITVIVLRGQDQLQEPQGRFSKFEDVEQSCNKNKAYEFNWNELLETRLVFP